MLLGAVGGPKWSDPNAKVRPEQGLLAIRKALGLFANLRPVKPHPAALDAAPIKPHLLTGVDMIVVRELTGGIYFGDKTRSDTDASDLCRYSVVEIERVMRTAFRLAQQRAATMSLGGQGQCAGDFALVARCCCADRREEFWTSPFRAPSWSIRWPCTLLSRRAITTWW